MVAIGLCACLPSEPDVGSVELAAKKPKKPKKCKPHKKHQDCDPVVTATVDTSGGTVTTEDGLTLEIPFGALDGATTITVTTTDQTVPGASSPIFEFGPEGLVFAKPVTVTLELPSGVTTGQVYWSKLGSTTEFDAIGGTVDPVAHTISAQSFHFSLAYIGPETGFRDIIGGGATTWISASTRDSIGMDFSTVDVEAIYSDGNGGFSSVQGVSEGPGLFRISHVPEGEVIIRNGTQYLVTTSSLPDLGRTAGGRPIGQRRLFEPGESSLLTLRLEGLATWDPADQIEWFSSEADDWDFNSERLATFLDPNTAVLDIDVAFVNGASFGQTSEIHAAQGDRAVVGQLVSSTTTSGVPYLAMQRIAKFPPTFSAFAGDEQALTLTMTDVSTTNTLSLDYRGSQWKQVLDLYGNPASVSSDPRCGLATCGGFIGALGQAGGAGDGFYTANADMLVMYDATGQDIVTGPMHYADPDALGDGVSDKWGVLFNIAWNKRNFAHLPDTSGRAGIGRFGFGDFVAWTTTPDKAEASPLVPLLLPPANISVNGTAFFAGGGDVGATPTFAWTNPNSGALQPAFYTLRVIELTVDAANRSRGTLVATINTPNTSITLPPGITFPGHAYVFTLAATASTSAAGLTASPFKSAIDIAEAQVSSGLFNPGLHGIASAELIQGGQSYPLATTANATSLFWIEYGHAPWDPPVHGVGTIWTANLDGSNPRPLATNQDLPQGIAVSGNTLYWTNQGDGIDGAVMAMDLMSESTTQIATEPGLGTMLAFGGDIYWQSGYGTQRLHAGAISTVVVASGVSFTTDGINFYYTQYGSAPPSSDGSVLSTPFSGTDPVSTLVANQPQAWDVHSDGSFVYWSNQAWLDEEHSTINRIPIAGGPAETLVTGNELQKYFALDATNLYFVRDSFVWSVSKSGGTPQRIASVPNTFGCPQGTLTISAGALYFGDTCGANMGVYRVPL